MGFPARGMDLGQIDMLGKGDFARPVSGHSMTFTRDDAAGAGAGWRKLAVLVLAVAAVGLPINHVGIYALLLIVAVVVFTGEVSARLRAWAAALAIVAVADRRAMVAVAAAHRRGAQCVSARCRAWRCCCAACRREVYQHMAAEFDAVYPLAVRCKPARPAAGRAAIPSAPSLFPPTAFSTDPICRARRRRIDFSDPVWLRLGFVNERALQLVDRRARRAPRRPRPPLLHGPARWHFAMPWFEMIRLPAGLCRRPIVLARRDHVGRRGRPIRRSGAATVAARSQAADAGRRVFGIAIKPGTLAMHADAALARQAAAVSRGPALALAAAIGLILALVRVRARRTILPFILIGLAVVGHRRRRRELPRRRAAVRRRRRRAVLRRRRPRHSAEALDAATSPAFCRAAKTSSITAAPACAISARSSTSCSAKAISAISRWCCCCRC